MPFTSFQKKLPLIFLRFTIFRALQRDSAGVCWSRADMERTSERTDRRQVLDQVLGTLTEQLLSGTLKATVSDYIRLWQLRDGISDHDALREVVVRWIEPEASEPEA